MIGDTGDQIRVLTHVSGRVVRALLGDEPAHDGPAPDDDPFAEALRRYQEQGAPSAAASWRDVPREAHAGGPAAEVLRRLTRDLLRDVSAPPRSADEAADEAVEAPPPNVRRIDQPAEIPALELGEDGTWRPSGASLKAGAEADAGAKRRNLPELRSRYPEARPRGRGLPPPPSWARQRFTDITPAPEFQPPPPARLVSAAPPVEAPPPPAAKAEVPPPAPASVEAPAPEPAKAEESPIRAVARGTDLVAGTFDRFQELAEFVKALRAIDGIQDVATRQFVRGIVHLRVRHSRASQLADLLPRLASFAFEVVSAAPDRVEIRVQPFAPRA